ncbi:MAG TPA: hypothetical protein VM573_01025 [Actinomycetota bacterium]|jgi:hypothetical protein|nr:hypothetical protein [Actinomycetota bacterium]
MFVMATLAGLAAVLLWAHRRLPAQKGGTVLRKRALRFGLVAVGVVAVAYLCFILLFIAAFSMSSGF